MTPAVSRRLGALVLTALVVLSALAPAVGVVGVASAANAGNTGTAGNMATWTSFQGDPTHTGWRPDGTGPQGNGVDVLWTDSLLETDDTLEARSTPLVWGGVVAYVTGTGIYGFDAATGTQRWSGTPNRQTNTVPAVDDGVAYYAAHVSESGTPLEGIYAVEMGTGTQYTLVNEWDLSLSSPTDQFPYQYEVRNVVAAEESVVFTTQEHVVAVDPTTHAVRWEHLVHPVNPEYGGTVVGAPIIHDGAVYFGSLDLDDQLHLNQADLTTGAVTWQTDVGVTGFSRLLTPIAMANGRLYYVASNKGNWESGYEERLFAVDVATGTIVINQPLPAQDLPGQEIREGLAVTDSAVYYGTTSTLYALDADTGQKQWDRSLPDHIVTSPVVVGDSLYVGAHADGSHDSWTLSEIDPTTGQARWQTTLQGDVRTPLAVVDGVVHVGGDDVYAVADTGSSTAPEISVTPATVDFGDVTVGSSAQATVTVTNDGTAPLTVSGRSLGGSAAGQFAVSGAPAVLSPGQTVDYTLTFTPATTGSKSATLTIASDDADEGSLVVPLSGTGVAPSHPEIDVRPSTVDFGDVTLTETATAPFVIENTGTAPLDVSGVTLGGVDGSAFALGLPAGAGPGGSFTVAPGETASLLASYTPTTAAAHTATVTVASNDDDEAATVVSLAGTGLAEAAPSTAPDVTLDPVAVAFGEVTVGESATLAVVVRNDGDGSLSVTTTRIDARPASGSAAFTHANGGAFTLGPGAERTLTTTFAPTATGVHSTGLVVASNDADEPAAVVDLSGTGTAASSPTWSDDDDDDNDDSDGSGAGDDTPAPPSLLVDVTAAGTSQVNVSVRNAGADDGVSVDLSNRTTGNVTLDGIDLTPTTAGDFTLNVSLSEAPPPGAPADTPTGEPPISYLTVAHSIADEDIGAVTFHVRVSKAALAARGLAPDAVVVYRYHDGSWQAASMAVSDETATHYVFEATVPGLSVFAVSGDAPAQATTTVTSTPTETATATATPTTDAPTVTTAATDEPTETPASGAQSGFPLPLPLQLGVVVVVIVVAVAVVILRR